MTIASVLISIGLALLIGGVLFSRRQRKSERQRLLEAPFPKRWDTILTKRLECYPRLPAKIRSEMQRFAQVIAAEKNWEACGGLPEITEEMRVVVSAQAALLIAGRGTEDDFYPLLKSILIYPGAFQDKGRRQFDLSEDADDRGVRLGESWTSGSVILAWDSVLRGAADADNGMNVTLHEFAHQLDQVDGLGDGVPELEETEDFQQWSEVMQTEYEKLINELNENPGARTTIDPYGATNPAEFFAVTTEEFFEQPRQLKEAHPDLYAELGLFYRLDPAEWKRR